MTRRSIPIADLRPTDDLQTAVGQIARLALDAAPEGAGVVVALYKHDAHGRATAFLARPVNLDSGAATTDAATKLLTIRTLEDITEVLRSNAAHEEALRSPHLGVCPSTIKPVKA